MSELFSDEWMKYFPTVCDANVGISAVLENFGFKSLIGYGIKGKETSFSVAYISNNLQFLAGYNGSMIADLRIDRPFTKSIAAMGKA